MTKSPHEPTNTHRAALAEEALAVFANRSFGRDDPDSMEKGDLECAVCDLIADLMHFARRQGLDVEAVTRNAQEHFECEVLEDLLTP